MKKLILLFVLGIFFISLVSAIGFSDGQKVVGGGNYSINVNNTDYFQGYTPTTLRDWFETYFDGLYCLLTGCNITGNVTIEGGLNVTGNATFSGGFETTCLHCEDGNTYFHGDGFFEGNVTAPNIEVMESLIVHGNSTCTGTALACGDIYTFGLCGWTIHTGQRGCHWWFGNCIGTATPCEDMSTATCEEQHVCTLTSSVGFAFSEGNLNMYGNNITNVSYVNGVNISNLSGNYVPYTGAIDNVNVGNYNITTESNLIISNSTSGVTHWNMYEDANGTLVWEKL